MQDNVVFMKLSDWLDKPGLKHRRKKHRFPMFPRDCFATQHWLFLRDVSAVSVPNMSTHAIYSCNEAERVIR